MKARYLEALTLLTVGIVLTACGTGGAGSDVPVATLTYTDARATGEPFECSFAVNGFLGASVQYQGQVLGDDLWVAEISETDDRPPAALSPDERFHFASVDGIGYLWIPRALSEPAGYDFVPYRFDMTRVIDAYEEATGDTTLQAPFLFVMPRPDTPCEPIPAVTMHLPSTASSFADMTDQVVASLKEARKGMRG